MIDDRKTAVPTRLAGRKWAQARHEVREGPAAERPFGPLSALGTSVWFGLVVGLAELALTLALKPVFDSSPGFFRMNRHVVWTIPAVNLALFGLCGLALALVLRARPRWGVRCVLGPLNVLAVLTLLLTIRRIDVRACVVLACGIGYRLTLRAESQLPAFRTLSRRSAPALAAAVLGLAAVSLGGHLLREPWATSWMLPFASTGRDAPNVLLVVLDTVRADRMSLYGYPRNTTPNLTRLARRGVRFTQARSTAPWTLPSHASILTGRWHHELSVGIDRPLDGTHATLAEFLAANGYGTAGFVANTTYCSAETGLDRGFAHYEDHDLSPAGILWTSAVEQRIICKFLMPQDKCAEGNPNDYHRKDAARVRGDFFAWLDRQGDQPFFAFLNLFDAHNPYIPPAGFNRPFGIASESAADAMTLDRWFVLDKKTLAPRDHRLVSDAYDDCIAYLDEQLGHLFGELDRRGKLANTLVIVTADHGEHFGEHGLYGHASSLYDPEIHVPLLVLPPGGTDGGRSADEPVSLRDIPATIADVLGLAPNAPFPGRSLARHWKPSEAVEPEPVLAEIDGPVHTAPNQGRSPVFRGPMKAVVQGRQVYILNGDGREELYDLSSDPMEMHNLIDEPGFRPSAERLRKSLNRLLKIPREHQPAPTACRDALPGKVRDE